MADLRPISDTGTVHVIDPLADARWDAFVAAHPRAMPGHLGAWAGVLARAYRFRPRYLALEGEGGDLRGVLPMAGKRGPVSGARLRSLPVIPGPVGPIGAAADDEDALVAAACRMADEDGAPLRIRSRVGDYDDRIEDIAVMPGLPSYLLDVPSDADELRGGWKRQGNLARNLRRADAAGLTVRGGVGDDDLRAFHALYVRNMAKHRAVPHSLRFFVAARDLLTPRDAFVLVIIEKDGEAIAATISFVTGDTLEATFAVSDDRYRDARPSYAVWWHTIRAAIARGLHVVDFGGTTPGSSQADFKEQWGTRQVPSYEYAYPAATANGGAVGEGAGRSAGARLRRFGRERVPVAVWEQAPPAVRRAAGEVFYRYL